MAKSLDLYIDQGADFVAVLPAITDFNGNVVNLTGYTIVSQIRRSYATIFAVQLMTVILDADRGLIQLSLPASETTGLVSTRYVYDVMLTNTSNFVTKAFEGIVIVNPSVSNNPNTTLLTPYIPDDWGGI